MQKPLDKFYVGNKSVAVVSSYADHETSSITLPDVRKLTKKSSEASLGGSSYRRKSRSRMSHVQYKTEIIVQEPGSTGSIDQASSIKVMEYSLVNERLQKGASTSLKKSKVD